MASRRSGQSVRVPLLRQQPFSEIQSFLHFTHLEPELIHLLSQVGQLCLVVALGPARDAPRQRLADRPENSNGPPYHHRDDGK
jgi:hypothetical protein